MNYKVRNSSVARVGHVECEEPALRLKILRSFIPKKKIIVKSVLRVGRSNGHQGLRFQVSIHACNYTLIKCHKKKYEIS